MDTSEKYICLNGEIHESDAPILYSSNRAFRYGDSVFESMRFTQKQIPFFKKHWQRLQKAMAVLFMQPTANFTEELVLGYILRLIEKNNIPADARVRLTVFRSGDGTYTPTTNTIEYLIEVDALEDDCFVLNPKGLLVDIYNDLKKSKNILSPYKIGSAALYVMAGINKIKNELDDSIIINDKGNIIEATSSNIFAVKNGVLYTPPIEEGCINGVMRNVILEIAKENRIAVYEIGLAFNVMLNADEVFLTDAVNGIRWISSYKAKRYFNTMSKTLVDKLNAAAIKAQGV
ncbi:MAG: aminotransferase class IV [Bacteroidetes bacterium]|nr:aminotransferase class IV [Bacteroidota bacterium]